MKMKHFMLLSAALFCFAGVLLSASEPSAFSPVLLNETRLSWEEIPAKAFYAASTTVRDEFEVKLEEFRDKKQLWQIVSYDPAKCLVKIDHERKGVWPFRHDEAEIEIKPLLRGDVTAVFRCGEKEVTFQVKAL